MGGGDPWHSPWLASFHAAQSLRYTGRCFRGSGGCCVRLTKPILVTSIRLPNLTHITNPDQITRQPSLELQSSFKLPTRLHLTNLNKYRLRSG